MSDATREAAAAILGDVEAEQPEATAVEEVQHEAEEELPEDIQELLAQPDIEEDEESEEDYTLSDDNQDEQYMEPEDAAKLRKRALRAEKRAAFLEDLRVKSETKKWRSEATKYFKYADTDTIEAKSRSSFLRQAKEQHESIKGRVEQILADERAQAEATTAQIRADNRQQARDAWGQPVETHGQTPDHVEATNKRESALKANRFGDSIRARLSDPDDPVTRALS